MSVFPTEQWACKTVAILLHFSLTALFCWMLVEGLHLYVLLVKVFKRGSHIKKYCAIGWGKYASFRCDSLLREIRIILWVTPGTDM